MLLEAGRAAQRFNAVMNRAARVATVPELEAMMQHYLHVSILFQRAGGHLTPTFHLMLHCIQRSRCLGNPKHYMTYRDESLNGAIARVARSVHRCSGKPSCAIRLTSCSSRRASGLMCGRCTERAAQCMGNGQVPLREGRVVKHVKVRE